MAGGGGRPSGTSRWERRGLSTCSWGQPFCRASTGSWRGVLLRLMPVLTSRTWSRGQQLPCRGVTERRLSGLAVPGSALGSPVPATNLPAAHPRWLSSGSCRSATTCAFGALPPPGNSPQLWTPPGNPAHGYLSLWPRLLQDPWGHRAHHGVLYVQAVELGAGLGQHDQSVGGHAVAVRKLEEGEPRTALANQLWKTEHQPRLGLCGPRRKETSGRRQALSTVSARTSFLPWKASTGAPTSDTSLLKEKGKENPAGIPMGPLGSGCLTHCLEVLGNPQASRLVCRAA